MDALNQDPLTPQPLHELEAKVYTAGDREAVESFPSYADQDRAKLLQEKKNSISLEYDDLIKKAEEAKKAAVPESQEETPHQEDAPQESHPQTSGNLENYLSPEDQEKLKKTVGGKLFSLVNSQPFDVEPVNTPFRETNKMRARLKSGNTWHKGVNLDKASPEMIRALDSLATMAERSGHKLLITSGHDGKHAPNSAHYGIGAVDVRILKGKADPKTGSDEFDKKVELALALKYASKAGFKSARDEITNGKSPHIHLSMGEQWSDPYNYVLGLVKKPLEIARKNG